MDVWGLPQNVSIDARCYFVTFIDHYTLHTWAWLIEKRSKVLSCFLKVKSPAEWETDKKIKHLRYDGGKEYFSN